MIPNMPDQRAAVEAAMAAARYGHRYVCEWALYAVHDSHGIWAFQLDFSQREWAERRGCC